MILTALLLALSQPCTVTDGDTIRCGSERIRIANIDTPELRGRCPYEIHKAHQARLRMVELLGEEFRVVRRGRDRFGRTLADVIRRRDGADLGAVMIREGHARRWEGRRRAWC